MKLSNALVMTVLTAISHIALAGGGSVDSDQINKVNVTVLDCRKGDNFWDTNKGFKIDLSDMTVTSYKDNGYTKGQSARVQCQGQGTVITCEGDNFRLTLPNIQSITQQESSDASDILGGLVGGSGKYVMVTSATMETDGLIFGSSKAMVCALK